MSTKKIHTPEGQVGYWLVDIVNLHEVVSSIPKKLGRVQNGIPECLNVSLRMLNKPSKAVLPTFLITFTKAMVFLVPKKIMGVGILRLLCIIPFHSFKVLKQ